MRPKNLLMPNNLLPAAAAAIPVVQTFLLCAMRRHTTRLPEVPPCHACGAPSMWGHLEDECVGTCDAHRPDVIINDTHLTIETITAEEVCGPITYFENMLNDMIALNRAGGAVIDMSEMDRHAAVVLAICVFENLIAEDSDA